VSVPAELLPAELVAGESFPRPRLFTPRQPELRPQTIGAETDRWHMLVMRHRLMPHQRYIADVAGEIDPETGRRHYDTGFVKLPRQNGKTWWLRAHMLAASRRAELVRQADIWIPSAGLPPRRIVVYTAQDRGKAREQIVTELIDQQLKRCVPLRGRYLGRRAQGSERIVWHDTGGRIQVESSNETAGHSLTIDDAVLDEAFAHEDLTLVNALEPTMLTKPDPLTLIVSTPGDGTDGLMLHYEELAAVAVNDPDTTMFVFDWSASEDDDRADPEVWRRVMPALGITITEARIRQLLSRAVGAGVAEFDRAYLARRPTSATVAALDLAGWANCRNLEEAQLAPAGAIVVGLEITVDRALSTLAIAGRDRAGRLCTIIRREPGTRWLVPAVRDLQRQHGVTVMAVWADRRAGLGGVIDSLAGAGVDVHETSAGDVASAAGTLWDLTDSRAEPGLVHDGQPDLDAAVRGSRRRPLGDAWTFDKLNSQGDVSPIAGVALAVAGYLQLFPLPPSGGIR
jgi:hypothetical protein